MKKRKIFCIIFIFFSFILDSKSGTNGTDLKVEEVIKLPKYSRTDQGVLTTKEGYFLVSNKDNNKSTGKIYKISKDLDQILSEVSLINSELNLWNDTEYILHFGQATYNKLDQRIYISVMDVGPPYWKLFIGKL